MSSFRLYNNTRTKTIADRIVLADTSLSRMVGLLGRKHLEPEEGLWIKPSSGVHTLGMSFAIDVVGLNKACHIVRLWRGLVPYRMTAISWMVRSVIELPAGTIQRHGLELGDSLSLIASGSSTDSVLQTQSRRFPA